jgi:transcriptional regulator with XRE-family HTH domain
MTDSHLQRVIRAEMRHRNLNEYQLAEAAGMQRDAVRNMLRGDSRQPRIEKLEALADYFRVTVDYLLGRGLADDAASVSGGHAVPRIPSQTPGADEWDEIRRFWEAASSDARRALVYMVRAMSKAEDIKPVTMGGGKPDEEATDFHG